jgi:oxalate decarboxylase/phosphoglucose isomerase-like protein (cupin superfamily)|tara:strand:- start:254 stop:673 length:420 start_codon:yes stop_codon:yes gene_type:complete
VFSKSTIIKSNTRDSDKRGSIISIVDDKISNVSIIKCNAGSIRSNHYHLEDYHYMYVLDGEIDYFFKNIDSDHINYLKVKKNQNIFTPPLEIHATYFPIKTTLIVSSLNPRDRETYEKDTRRVEFINHNNVDTLLSQFS